MTSKTLRRWLRNVFARPIRRPIQNRPDLIVELLETRATPDAKVSFSPDFKTLTLDGDAGSNQIRVSLEASGYRIQALGAETISASSDDLTQSRVVLDSNGRGATIPRQIVDGASQPVQIGALRVLTKGGADQLQFSSAALFEYLPTVTIDIASNAVGDEMSGTFEFANLSVDAATVNITSTAVQFSAVANAPFQKDTALTVTGAVSVRGRDIKLQAELVNIDGAMSTTTTGGIDVVGQKLSVGAGAVLRAGPLGDVKMRAADGLDLALLASNPFLRDQDTQTRLFIAQNAQIYGRNVTLSADANSAKFLDLETNTIDEGQRLAAAQGVYRGTGAVAFAPGTITRSDGKAWAADDGFQVGDSVLVSSTLRNNGLYEITGINGNVLSVSADLTRSSRTLVAESIADPNVRAADVYRGPATFASNGDTALDTIAVAGSLPFTKGQALFVYNASVPGNNLVEASIDSVAGGTLALSAPAAVTSGTGTVILAAEKVQLVGLVRADPNVGMTGAPTLTFNAANKTIARSTGDWASDGFVAGGLISVRNTAENDAIYTIQTVSGATLTLSSAATIFNESTSDGEIIGVIASATGAIEPEPGVAMTGAPSLTIDPSARTIVRSAGSWDADNFQPGKMIQISGTTDNDGAFLVLEVSGNVLVLDGSLPLKAETTSNASVIGVRQASPTALTADKTALVVSKILSSKENAQKSGAVAKGKDSKVRFAAVDADAASSVTIDRGVRIEATGDVSISSVAQTKAKFKNSSYNVGITWGSSNASAEAIVRSGAIIMAGGDFALASRVRNVLDVQTKIEAGSKLSAPTAVAITYGSGRSSSNADVQDGAQVTAQNVQVVAANNNDFNVASEGQPLAEGLLSKKTSANSQAMGLSYSDMESTASASLGGTIISHGAADVRAESINVRNNVRSFAFTKDGDQKSSAADSLFDPSKLAGFAAKFNLPLVQNLFTQADPDHESTDADAAPAAPAEQPRFGFSAAIAVGMSQNVASAQLGSPQANQPAAQIQADGSIHVSSLSEDNYKAASVGSAGSRVTYAIGGAVTWGDYDNRAKATIAPSVHATAGREVNVDSETRIPDQITIQQDLDALLAVLKDLDDYKASADTITDDVGAVDKSSLLNDGPKALVDAVKPHVAKVQQMLVAADVMKGIKDYFSSPAKIVSNKIANTFSGANAQYKSEFDSSGNSTSDGAKITGSGSLTFLAVNNEGNAAVGDGAIIAAGAALARKAFDLASTDAATDQIALVQSGIAEGDALTYRAGVGPIDGLVDGQTYYAVKDVRGAMRLTDAIASTFDPGVAVNRGKGTFDLGYRHEWRTGQAVLYRADGAPIAGLVDGEIYYVIIVSPSVVQLASTKNNALAATQINGLDGRGLAGKAHRLIPIVDIAANSANRGQLVPTAVRVNSRALMTSIDVGGLGPLQQTSGGVFSIGASTLITNKSNRATSSIGESARLDVARGDTVVTALADTVAFNVVLAGSKGQKFVGSGSVGVNIFDNEALAWIEPSTNVTSSDGDLQVFADGKAFSIDVAGAISQGANALGIAVAVKDYDSVVRAFIGDNNNVSAPAGTIAVAGRVQVNSSERNRFFDFALAGSIAQDTYPPSPGVFDKFKDSAKNFKDQAVDKGKSLLDNLRGKAPTPGPEAPVAPASKTDTPDVTKTPTENAGLGISASVSFMDLDTVVESYIRGSTVTTKLTPSAAAVGNIDIGSKGDTFIVGVDGAVALSKSVTANTTSGAGAANIVLLSQSVRAFAEDANLTAKDVAIKAESPVSLFFVSAGGAGGNPKANSKSISGSVNVGYFQNLAEAYLGSGAKRATVSAAGSVTVDALSPLRVVNIAGGLAIGGDAVGAAIQVLVFTNSALAYVGAHSQIVAGSDVRVHSQTSETLDAIAAQLVASLNGSSGNGTISIIVGSINSQAKVGDSATVSASGKAEVTADDSVDLVNVAGGFALGGKAVGVALGIDVFGRTVSAIVGNDALLTAAGAGGVTVKATADDAFLTMALGAAIGTSGITFEASVLIDLMDSDTIARIGDRAAVKATNAVGSVNVSASHDSSIHSGAGSLAGGQGSSVGAAVDVQILDKTTQATLGFAAVLEAGKDATLKAQGNENVQAGAAAGAGSLSGFAGSGSAMVVDLTKDTEAIVGDGSRITAIGNVLVLADSTGDFNMGAGAGALALTGAGVAGSIIVLDHDDVVKARIAANADVSGRGALGTASVPTGEYKNHKPVMRDKSGVIVAATSSEDFLTIVAGVAVSGGSAALAGSIIITTATEATTASIGAGASVNKNNDGDATQNVAIVAGDDTKRVSVAGALGGGASGGVGLGVDVAVTSKTTDATIEPGAQVKAQETILVQALNEDEVRVVAASLGVGGTAGVAGAAGVSVNTIATRARVLDGTAPRTLLRSEGNVVVSADDRFESDFISGSGAGGGSAGVGGSAAAIVVSKDTIADIGANADVIAKANRAAADVRVSTFTAGTETSGDKEVAKPALDLVGTTGDSATDAKLGPRANAPSAAPSPTTAARRGVIVTATSVDDVETVVASGAVGGTIGVTLAASVYVLKNNTLAAIGSGAKVNDSNTGTGAGQQVLVGAGYHLSHLGAAGSASGGGSVGAGVGGNVSMAVNSTQAIIGAGAIVRAANDIIVTAAAREEILTLGVGLGVGGVAGIAGSFVALVLDNTTLATVGIGATLDAGGNVIVSAVDFTASDTVVGSVGVGFKGGVGASVGVILATKDTEATLSNNATVDAKGNGSDFAAFAGGFNNGFNTELRRGVIVQAGSREELLNVAVSGAGGLFVGVAGGIAVETVTGKTIAAIGSDANINQNNAGANGAQDVVVVAVQSLDELAVGGGLGIGAIGIAGGIDIGSFNYDTKAIIGDRVKTMAADDVKVSAVSERTLASAAVSSGGGLVSVAGAVSVYSMGTGPDANGSSSLGSADSFSSDQLQSQSGNSSGDGSSDFLNQVSSAMNSASSGSDTAKAQAGFASAGTSLRSAASGKRVNLSAATAPGTVAKIGDGGKTEAGDSVTVSARETLNFSMTTGSTASGAVSVGGSVIVLSIADNVQALLGGDVKAGGKISVLANYDATVNGLAFGGAAGLVGLGAQVVLVSDSTTVQALVANHAILNTPATVEVFATSKRNETAEAKGASVGGLAAGAAIAEVHISGATKAKIGDAVAIGTVTQATGNIDVRADASDTAKADVLAVAAGVGAGAGNKAQVDVLKDGDAVEASIGDGGDIVVAGDVSVASTSTQLGEADAIGVAVGALAFGISQAFVNVGPNVQATIGTSNVRTGRRINVKARHNSNPDGTPLAGTPLSAEAIASSGGIVAGSGGVAKIQHTADVGARSQASGSAETIDILATATRTASPVAGGVTIGGVGIGVMVSKADVRGDTAASIGGKISAVNISTVAKDRSDAKALTLGATGGVLAVGVNISEAKVAPNVSATVLADAYLVADNDVLVRALGDDTAKADTVGLSLGQFTVASSESDIVVAPTVRAALANSAQIHAGNTATVEATLPRARADAESSSSSGSMLGVAFVKSTVTQTSDVSAMLGDGAMITALNAVNVLANANNQIVNDANALTAGIAAGQDATTVEDIRTTAQVTFGSASAINVLGSGGKATIKANNQVNDTTTVQTKFLGGLSLNFAEADTSIRGVNDAPLALVTFGQKSQVEAETVAVNAQVDALNVNSKALGQQYAAGGLVRTTSKMDVASNTEIRQQTGSVLSGETLTLFSGQDAIRLVALGRGEGFGAVAAHDGQTFQTVALNSKIIVDAGATLLANVMRLETHAADASDLIKQDTERDSFGIDPASDDFELTVNARNEVNIAGTLVDGVKWLDLQVNAAGAIAKNKGYTVQFVGNTLVIQKLDPDGSVGSTTLIAPTPNPTLDKDKTPKPDIFNAAGEVIFGPGAERRAPDRIKRALVVNASAKDVRIDDFDMTVPGSLGALTIVDGNNSPSGVLAGGPIFKVLNPTVTIFTNAQPGSDLLVNGTLNNPLGTTRLFVSGDLTRTGSAAVIKTADLTMTTATGIIGSAATPLQVKLEQEADRDPAPRLFAEANGAVAIQLLPATIAQTILVPSIAAATGDVTLDFGGNNMTLTGVIRSIPTGNVRIANINDIVDNHPGVDSDIATATLVIKGTGNFGTKTNPLETTMTTFESASTLGGVFIANNAGFTIGGLDPLVTGVKAAGGVELRGLTAGAVSVLEDVQAGGDIVISAADGPALNTENIVLKNGVAVESANGGVALLAGDTIPLNPTHRLKALSGEIVLGYDQGNADPGEIINLTLPEETSGILASQSLRILTDSDTDTLTISNMYIPTTWEAGGGFDALVATLDRSLSSRTSVTAIQVEKITFDVSTTQNANWTFDTTDNAQIALFGGATKRFLSSRLTALVGGQNLPIVSAQNDRPSDFNAIDGRYAFSDGVDDLKILRADYPLTIALRGGDDTARLGGLRLIDPADGSAVSPALAVSPSEANAKITIEAGSGSDVFKLEDLRAMGTTPVGRLDRLDANTGMIRDYDREQESAATNRVTLFKGFENTEVNFGDHSSIFSVLNTVTPTTINAGAGADAINLVQVSHLTHVNLEGGDDTLNVQGIGDLVIASGGTNTTPSDTPDTGDRVVIGVTRTFTQNEMNTQLNADGSGRLALDPGHIGIFGHGWFTGQEVVFNTTGIAPKGLVPGQSYYVIREDRNFLRLATTQANALAHVGIAIATADLGLGENSLTMAKNGVPLWGRSLSAFGSDNGQGDGIPSFFVSQPGSEQAITFQDASDRVNTASPHGLANGQRIGLLTDGALPGNLRSDLFYFVVNATPTSFQISLTKGGASLDITANPGQGKFFVATVGELRLEGKNAQGFVDFEKANVLLGNGDDTFVLNNSVDNLQLEIRGNAGDDTFVLRSAKNTAVIRGDAGANDTIKVVVEGTPQANQFAGLQISAGIERLLVDNSDNPNPVNWSIAEGSLYFAPGGTLSPSLNVASDVFTAAGHGLKTGAKVILSSDGGMPTYLDTTQTPSASRNVEKSVFFYAIPIDANSFKLASSPGEAAKGEAVDFVSSGSGALKAQPLALLVGMEGAAKSQIISGRSDITGDGKPDVDGAAISTLTVLSSLDLAADVNGNRVRLVEGLRVLDHANTLSKLSFPAFRVDGLLGVKDVASLSTSDGRRWVIGAGTGEDELAIFERREDLADPTTANLDFVSVMTSVDDGVPAGPKQLVLSGDGKFLYVLGTTELVVFQIAQVRGLLKLTRVSAVAQAGNDFTLSSSGDLAFVTQAAGFVVYDRNTINGGLSLRQTVTQASVTAIDNGPVKGLQNPTSIVASADDKRLFVGDAQGGVGTFERANSGEYKLITKVEIKESRTFVRLKSGKILSTFDSDGGDELFIQYLENKEIIAGTGIYALVGTDVIFNKSKSTSFAAGAPFSISGEGVITNTATVYYEFREEVGGASDNSYGFIAVNPESIAGPLLNGSEDRTVTLGGRLEVTYTVTGPTTANNQILAFAADGAVSAMTLSPDGKALYVATASGKLYTLGNVDTVAADYVQLDRLEVVELEHQFPIGQQPAGDRLFVSANNQNVFNADGAQVFQQGSIDLSAIAPIPLSLQNLNVRLGVGRYDPSSATAPFDVNPEYYGGDGTEVSFQGLTPGSVAATLKEGLFGSGPEVVLHYTVFGGAGIALTQLDLETNNVANVDGIGAPQAIVVSADGKTVYVTGKTVGNVGAVATFGRGADNTLTFKNRVIDTGSVKGLGNLTSGAAAEETFGAAGMFADFAGTDLNGLVSFKIGADGSLAFLQGPDRNKLDRPYGTGDGDPAGQAKRVQGLTANPMFPELYLVAPSEGDNNLYVLSDVPNSQAGQSFYRVTGFFHDESENVNALKGASAIAVSPNGQFIYVLSPGEDAGAVNNRIGVFEHTATGVVFRGPASSAVLGGVFDPNNPPLVRAHVSPDGKALYVSGPGGLEILPINTDGTLGSAVQTLAGAKYNVADFADVPGSNLTYAVSPGTNALLIFDRNADGSLANERSVTTRLDAPMSVVVSPAVDAGSVSVPAGRHIYVGSAGNNSISVFVDPLGAGDLTHLQMVREGAQGVRGLEGVSSLKLSDFVPSTKIGTTTGDPAQISGAQIDSQSDLFNIEFHGLRTGQKVVFTSAAPAGLTAGKNYWVRTLSSNAFQLAETEADARNPLGAIVDLAAETGDQFTLTTSIAAGAYFYAAGTADDAITTFERNDDPLSADFGKLSFLQVINNRIGNQTSGSNDGLYRPDSIVTVPGDTTRVFVSSSFDPLLSTAPGGLVTFTNNPNKSPQLPPVELNVEFSNMAALNMITGAGDDRINIVKTPRTGSDARNSADAHVTLSIDTGSGDDEVTLNDVSAGAGSQTNVKLGDGDDTFTIRRKVGVDPTVNVEGGAGDDQFDIAFVQGGLTLNIDPGTGNDTASIDASGVDAGSVVNFINTEAVDHFRIESGVAAPAGQSGSQYQVAGFGAINVGSAAIESFASLKAVAQLSSNAINEGDGVTLDASASLTPAMGGRVEYAWDLNRDGAFTELVTSSPMKPLSWLDVRDYILGAQSVADVVDFRIPLRVSYSVDILDPLTGDVIGVDTRVSFDEVDLAIHDVLPTLFVTGDATTILSADRPPYAIELSATDPADDTIVQWTVAWGDGQTDLYSTVPQPTHRYSKPGVYTIQVSGIDNENHNVPSVSHQVTVSFDPSLINVGGPYFTLEGQGVALDGSAFGAVDANSYQWTVNGQTAGTGAPLNLDWQQLKNLGVANDGVFDVRLTATYNAGADVVTSNAAKLTVANVLPTAKFRSTGTIDEGSPAQVFFTNAGDVVDTTFTYSYDFGDGVWIDGPATMSVPSTAKILRTGGSNTILGRVFDGTDYALYETELIVRELPPSLLIDKNQQAVAIDEGSQATLSGVIVSPGGDPVTLTASIGTVVESSPGRWTWTFTPDDGPFDSQQVTITAVDDAGLPGSIAFDLIVINRGPNLQFVNNGPVNEGSPATVTFQNVVDPSSADQSAGFTYSYDFGDGVFVPGGATANIPAALLAKPGTIVIRGKVADKDGYAIYQTTIQVLPVAPVLQTPTLTLATTTEGQSVLLEAVFTDPGALNFHRVRVNWGDETFDIIDIPEGDRAFSLTHRYADNSVRQASGQNTYDVTVTLSDDSGLSDVKTLTATVNNVAPANLQASVPTVAPTGMPITVSGTFADAGVNDVFHVDIVGSDGGHVQAEVGGRETIDFELSATGSALIAGQTIANQFLEPGNRGFLVSTGVANHPAKIFDSANPGGQAELGTPNQAFSGPGVGVHGEPGQIGVNALPLGNILILSDGGTSPNASGGTLIFDFPTPVYLDSIDLVHIATQGNVVETYSEAGILLSRTVIPLLGENSFQRVFINQTPKFRKGVESYLPVARMVVRLTGEAGVARLDYRYTNGSTDFAIAYTPQTAGADVVGYVESLYVDLLGRKIDAIGYAYWKILFEQGKLSRTDVARGLLDSHEYHAKFVKELYPRLFGRAGDADGVKFWTQALDRGLSFQDLEATFLASAEYFTHAGGSLDTFVTALYADILDRTPDMAGRTEWLRRLNAGTSRLAVVQAIQSTQEALETQIRRAYDAYVHQPLAPERLAALAAPVLNGKLTRAQVEASVLATDEYFASTQTATPQPPLTLTVTVTDDDGGSVQTQIAGPKVVRGFVEALYADLLGRDLDAIGAANWKAKFEKGLMSRADVIRGILGSNEYHQRFVRDLYQKNLGRPGDALGVAAWTKELDAGLSFEELENRFLASDEYAQRFGGDSERLLTSIYIDVLGRDADSIGLPYWTQKLAAGASRLAVIREINSSSDGAKVRIAEWYETFLRRTADNEGLAYWSSTIPRSNPTRTDVLVQILASDEYFNRVV